MAFLHALRTRLDRWRDAINGRKGLSDHEVRRKRAQALMRRRDDVAALEEALRLFESIDQEYPSAIHAHIEAMQVQEVLGFTWLQRGDVAAAEVWLERSLSKIPKIRIMQGGALMRALIRTGHNLRDAGAHEAARRKWTEAFLLARAAHDAAPGDPERWRDVQVALLPLLKLADEVGPPGEKERWLAEERVLHAAPVAGP